MIAKKTKSKDAQAAEFIGGAGKNGQAKLELRAITVNVDRELLERIDSMARLMGLNRSSFIISATAEKLRQLEQK